MAFSGLLFVCSVMMPFIVIPIRCVFNLCVLQPVSKQKPITITHIGLRYIQEIDGTLHAHGRR